MGKLLLRELVDVRMGHSFRASLEPDRTTAVGVIQMKDLGEDHTVDLATLARVAMDVRPGQRVREGDIILRSRGDRATCAIVVADSGCAIVAAPLLLLRVAGARVLPAYLNWFINQPPTQAHLARRAEGSNVKMITKRVLEDLEIEVPPLERQRKIVELAGLSARQRILEDDLDSLRVRLQSGIMMTYARGGPER